MRAPPSRLAPVLVPLVLAALGCSVGSRAGDDGARVTRIDRPDLPLAGSSPAELDRFREGDALFEATLRETDGLGPLYIRASCAGCHQDDGRGPGLVGKMAVVEADGVTPASTQELLGFGATERPYRTTGVRRALTAPEGEKRIRVTYRLAPPVFGRGYLEAVADADIERLARLAAERSGPIRGRIHRVLPESALAPAEKPEIGRFGLKARIATLDEFSADALQGDMGITSPIRPEEPPNPDGLRDDHKPGVDVDLETVRALADYLRLLEIPERRPSSDLGRVLFAEIACATCHVPSLRTRADYPIAALAGVEARVYTDFLLHDMGERLSDSVKDGDAGPREWKTAPLIGLRFMPAFLHDGRAPSVEAAVLAHEGPGSEANASVARFRALKQAEREELLRFVESL